MSDSAWTLEEARVRLARDINCLLEPERSKQATGLRNLERALFVSETVRGAAIHIRG